MTPALQLGRIALGPLLLWQGARVRTAALRLPEAAGDRAGAVGEGEPLRLLIVGDSAAAGVGIATQERALAGRLSREIAERAGRRVLWALAARTGATSHDARTLLESLAPHPVDVAVVAVGVNDVTDQIDRTTWGRRLNALHATIRLRFGARDVVYSGLPPVHRFPLLPQPLRWYLGTHARHLDSALEQWAAGRDDARYVPLPAMGDDMIAEDGFHPGEGAVQGWAGVLAETVTTIAAMRVEAGNLTRSKE